MKPNLLSRLVVSVAVVTVACGWAEPPTAPVAARPAAATRPPALTVAAVYRRVQQTISRPGLLYRATIQYTGWQDTGYFTGVLTGTITEWVDARRGVYRTEQRVWLHATKGSGTPSGVLMSTYILTPHAGAVREEPGHRIAPINPAAVTCPGATLTASAVLGCPGSTLAQRSTIAVQRGRYAGHPTIVLVTTSTWSGSDSGPVTSTTRLYLDPRTFLPIARMITTQTSSKVKPGWQRWVYVHTFIPVRSVPAHFFDPATLGRPTV